MQKSAIKRFVREDRPAGDITTDAIFTGPCRASGVFLAKQVLVVSGFAAVKEILAAEFPALKLKLAVDDGECAAKGIELATLSGSASDLLAAERLCLNVLQRMSGIATLTAEFVRLAKPRGVTILDTRKTTPGLREWERRAVVDGGGVNHRMSLSDQYLIKDNHIVVAGSVSEALARVVAHKKRRRSEAKIEVEVTDLEQLREALAFAPDIVLLDNMPLAVIRKAVLMRNKNLRRAPLLEISGGVTLDNVREFLLLGVERVSIGALTHSARAADISLEVS